MTKIDFKKAWKNLYQPSKTEFQVVEVPDMAFFKVDGQGTPGVVPEYTAAIEALYAMSYKTKFLSKKLEKDYVVPPLEGLWWADDMATFTIARDKSQWQWTMMIMTPDWITEEMVNESRKEVLKRKICPRWRNYVGRSTGKVSVFRSFTWDRTMMKDQCWPDCTKSGCRNRAIHLTACIMKFISATPERLTPKN